MGYGKNIAAINAANQALKAAGYESSAAALKQARAKHFEIKKVDDEWHVLIIEPLPSPEEMSGAIALSQGIREAFVEARQAGPTAEAIAAGSLAQPEPAPILQVAAIEQAQSASVLANAAAFFASRAVALANGPAAMPNSAATPNSASLHEGDAAQASEEIGDDALEEFAEAQRKADALANAQQTANTSPGKGGKEWVHVSTCESPVKRVHAIADAMVAQAESEGKPMPSRKEIQDECVRRGVASGTARTQFQAWKKARDNTLANAANAKALSDALNAKFKR